MSGKNSVVESTNNHDASHCVDIFMRPDGTFGFEEFRRDFEDNRGWFPIGSFSNRVFDSQDAARREASATVSWLNE